MSQEAESGFWPLVDFVDALDNPLAEFLPVGGLGVLDEILVTSVWTDLDESGFTLAARQAKKQAQEARKTFGECADAFIAAKSHEWRNEKHRAQWKMTLETYAAPLRSRPVDEIDTEAVLSVLQPIWQAKPETASRLRGRIESVQDAAKVAGHRQSENPARWKGHLEKLLAKPAKLSRGHHAAMPYGDVFDLREAADPMPLQTAMQR